jgi:hypothetical protein
VPHGEIGRADSELWDSDRQTELATRMDGPGTTSLREEKHRTILADVKATSGIAAGRDPAVGNRPGRVGPGQDASQGQFGSWSHASRPPQGLPRLKTPQGEDEQVDSESNDESRTLGPASMQNRLRPTLPHDQGSGMCPARARSVDRHALDSPVGTRKIELAALARDCDTGTNLKGIQRLSRSTTLDLLRPVSRHDSDTSPPRHLSRAGRAQYV